jgi:cell division protein FtsW
MRNRVAAMTAQWDFPLLAILAIMIAVGLVMVFSASYFRFGVNYFLRQIAWVGAGLLVMFITARIPPHWWERLAIPIMIVALIGLAGVLLFGDDRFGARRTFFGSIQPSELAKLAVVIYVSTWVASKGRLLADMRGGLIPFAILMGLVASLIVLEPNFSTAIVVLTIGIAIFFVGGADIKQLLLVGVIGILMFALLLWQSPHAFDRIKGWWDMLADPTLAPENIRHAIELMRRRDGLIPDSSVWSQKLSVALLWSDYLFANIGADLGLIGQLAVIILYAGLGYRCLGIALNAADHFSALVAIGVTTWILVQAIMHIGTSIALIPATGQPLPFMSYGGSAMVASLAGIGLLLGIAHRSSEKKSVYASFALGGRDRGTRIPDPGRGRRVDKDGRRRGR